MIEQIAVGVDGSASALHATRWAATEATLRGARLRLVHVRELPVLLPPTDLYAAELTDHGTKCLAAAEAEARAVAPTVDVHTDMRTGRPAEELVDETANASLVVVGSRGLGGFRSLLLGSVANSLTALGRCPIVVMRGRTPGAPPPDTGPVVVGADGTPASMNALEFALTAAAARDAEVLAVHAWTFDNLAEGWTTSAKAVHWDDIAVAQHRLFEHQLATARENHPTARVRSVHYWGHPADGILEHANDARLVIVGVHGHHRLPLGTIGSTSNAVLHHATCPVAVVPLDRKA